MATLIEDIRMQSAWIVKAFKADGLKLDYSLESLKQVDKFFDLHAKDGKAVPGGRLSQNMGAVIFSIGAYVGETFIKNVPGAVWETDDSNPEGEITAAIKFPDGGEIWPMQRVMKRFMNGGEDSVYGYAYALLKDHIKIDPALSATKKPWWKFW